MKRIARYAAMCPALVLLLLCACGPKTSSGTYADTEKTTFVICVDTNGQDVSSLTRRFAGMHPDLEVVVETVPNWESGVEREAYLTSLRAEILAGRGPDVLYLASSAFGYGSLFADENKVMATGMLEDLGDWLPQQTMDALHPVVLQAGQYKGTQYIMPVDYGVAGLVFSDQSIARAAHILEEVQTSYDFAESLPALYALYDEPDQVLFDISLAIQGGMMDYAAMAP